MAYENLFHFPSQSVVNVQNYLRMLLKVRQGPVLKPIRNTGPTDGLLPHTGNHLGYVNEGAWKDEGKAIPSVTNYSQITPFLTNEECTASLMSYLQFYEGVLFTLITAQQNRIAGVREAFLLLVHFSIYAKAGN